MRILLTILLFLTCAIDNALAQEYHVGLKAETVVDSLSNKTDSVVHKKKLSWIRRVIRGFSKIDTSYIEPQKYNLTVMLQNTTSFEGYTYRNDKGQEVVFSPQPSYKLGPYFGWRWVFLGYTIDLKHIGGSSRQGFEFSLYANQVGIDLFYRKSGDNYRIGRTKLGGQKWQDKALKHADFDGFESSERGFDFYYIFNHKKFSYPAAYSQSTVQRKSCGTALAGLGYTHHKLNVEWDKYFELIDERLGAGTAAELADTTLHNGHIDYTDLSLSGGYAYNWVFAKNWLFDISLQGALGYKRSHSDTNRGKGSMFHDFKFSNFNIDGISRVGLVWNTMRWYAGASAVFHTYNYRRKRFRANSTFGNINIYVGFNFCRR